MSDASAQVESRRKQFEKELMRVLPQCPATPEALKNAIHYSVMAGGKRIRPMLVYGACDAVKLEHSTMNGVACALELIHTYSLIHDDLPAMDDDMLRRGRPTCHVAFDEATAILAGDALQALAFEILATDPALRARPEAQARIIGSIAKACGPSGMAGGQALDLAAIGQDMDQSKLNHMHQMKTGALIQVSAISAALFAGTSTDLLDRLKTYGACVGLAFQIFDDILDVTGSAEATGKSTQKDARLEKPTFPGLLGLEGSQAEAFRLRDQAIAQLDGFPGDISVLKYLAAVAVERES